MTSSINKFEKVHPYAFSKELIYMFVGEYINGKFQFEFNPNINKYFSVKEVNTNELIRFGVVGEGRRSYFNITNGVFTHNKLDLHFIYKIGDIEYDLTNSTNVCYNDIIYFKEAVSVMSVQGMPSRTNFLGYNYGYKTQLQYQNGVRINFQPIMHCAYRENPRMDIRLVANVDAPDGKLVIRTSRGLDYITPAPLQASKHRIFNWTVEE